MPLYTYVCQCGNIFESWRQIAKCGSCKCEQCGKVAKQTIGKPPAVHNFKLGVFEHIAEEPIYVKSKKHLKELCNRYGCYAPGVLD